jgi:hypothetical protein
MSDTPEADQGDVRVVLVDEPYYCKTRVMWDGNLRNIETAGGSLINWTVLNIADWPITLKLD